MCDAPRNVGPLKIEIVSDDLRGVFSLYETASYELNKFRGRRMAERSAVPHPGQMPRMAKKSPASSTGSGAQLMLCCNAADYCRMERRGVDLVPLTIW